jgi:multimeric flavodoxin WrbA
MTLGREEEGVMAMKVTAVLGSPHGFAGSTGQVLQQMLAAVESAGAEVTTLSLATLEVRPCRACDLCHKTGDCGIHDDFYTIRNALLAADGVVLASPNYIFSVTAQMKALFDRCCGPLHCQAFSGKYAAAIVTSGGSGGDEVERYMLRFLRALGCRTVGSVGTEGWRVANKGTRAEVFARAEELGRQLVQAIRTRPRLPEQDEERHAFFERMRTLIDLRKDEWPYEYEYWKAGKATP